MIDDRRLQQPANDKKPNFFPMSTTTLILQHKIKNKNKTIQKRTNEAVSSERENQRIKFEPYQ